MDRARVLQFVPRKAPGAAGRLHRREEISHQTLTARRAEEGRVERRTKAALTRVLRATASCRLPNRPRPRRLQHPRRRNRFRELQRRFKSGPPPTSAVERRKKATYTLLFLSPLMAEMVSGSSPPIEWLSPNALGLLALYGCGALLIRDAVVRWNKGWATLLLLGCSYGVYEEGLVVKSWFDPNWPDIASSYGRVGGMGWMWAASLTLYHAVVSIAIPIFLVDVLFPDFKGKRLLTDRGTRWCLFFFGLTLPVYALALPYWGGPEHLIAVICCVGFFLFAREMPRDLLRAAATHAPTHIRRFAVFGFFWMFWNFLFPSVAEAIGIYFGVTIIVLIFTTLAALFVLRATLHPSNAERCLYAFVAGAFGFIMLFGTIYGAFNPAAGPGMVAVGPIAAAWFVWTYRKNLPRWGGERPAALPTAKLAPTP